MNPAANNDHDGRHPAQHAQHAARREQDREQLDHPQRVLVVIAGRLGVGDRRRRLRRSLNSCGPASRWRRVTVSLDAPLDLRLLLGERMRRRLDRRRSQQREPDDGDRGEQSDGDEQQSFWSG